MKYLLLSAQHHFNQLMFLHYCYHCKDELSCGEKFLCQDCRNISTDLPEKKCPRCLAPKNSKRCLECHNKYFFFDRFYSFMAFDQTTRSLLHQIKYFKKDWLIDYFFEKLKTHLETSELLNTSYDYLVPVPINLYHYYKREFNQSLLIAELLKKLSVKGKIKTHLLKATSKSSQVIHLQKDRLTNPDGKFKIKNRICLRNKSILLVDDIYTTGATINECSRLLKEAGAEKVDIFTLARTIPKYVTRY